MALRNRWLDHSSVRFHGGGTSSLKNWVQIAAIIVALAAVASAAGIYAVRNMEAQEERQNRFEDRLRDEHEQKDELVIRVDRLERAREHDAEIEAIEDRHAAEIAEKDRQHQADLERERRAAQAEIQRAQRAQQERQRAMEPAEPDPTVAISDLRAYKFRIVVTLPPSKAGDRTFYRERFSRGCDVPPSAIQDTRTGFYVHTDGCTDGTFQGFTVLYATATGS